jgi:hypothetical protein
VSGTEMRYSTNNAVELDTATGGQSFNQDTGIYITDTRIMYFRAFKTGYNPSNIVERIYSRESNPGTLKKNILTIGSL